MIKVGQFRKIGPTRRSVSGAYPFRGESSIQFESTLERDFIIRTEFFLDVLDIIPQPAEIKYGGRKDSYTPDFLVYYRSSNLYVKPMLVEVKPESEWRQNWRVWLPKWKAAWRYSREQGWDFHIYDESRIRDQVLKNIRFLEPYKRMHFPREESQWVIESVAEMGGAPMHYILARHFMGHYRREGVAHIWHLLATRRLNCDISLPLGENIELWVPKNDR